MKNLTILSYANFNGLNGAAGFVKLFFDNKEQFKKNGINLIIHSNSTSFQNESKYRKSVKFKIKNFIKILLNKTAFGRIRKFHYYLNVLGLKPVQLITDAQLNNGIIILNDMYVAYHYFKKYENKYKTVFMMHNNGDMLSMMNPANDKKIYDELKIIKDVIVSNTSCFVFVSEKGRANFIKIHPDKKDACIVINIGIKNPQIHKIIRDYSSLHLVSVGNISKRKNQIAILRALKAINDPSITLTLVGGEKIEDGRECSEYILKERLTRQVFLAGSQEDVTPFLMDANAFIMTSFDEGLPISAQEAMSYKLPLIMTDVGGCSELIEGNGYLITPNETEIVNAIRSFNNQLDKLQEMGECSYRIFLEKYTLEKMIEHYINLVHNSFL